MDPNLKFIWNDSWLKIFINYVFNLKNNYFLYGGIDKQYHEKGGWVNPLAEAGFIL